MLAPQTPITHHDSLPPSLRSQGNQVIFPTRPSTVCRCHLRLVVTPVCTSRDSSCSRFPHFTVLTGPCYRGRHILNLGIHAFNTSSPANLPKCSTFGVMSPPYKRFAKPSTIQQALSSCSCIGVAACSSLLQSCRSHLRWRDASPGASVTSLVSLIMKHYGSGGD